MTLTRDFLSPGLEFLGVFNLESVVYHLRPGQLVADFRFHGIFMVRYSWFYIPDFIFLVLPPDFRFQLSDLAISNFRFDISHLGFQILDVVIKIIVFLGMSVKK